MHTLYYSLHTDAELDPKRETTGTGCIYWVNGINFDICTYTFPLHYTQIPRPKTFPDKILTQSVHRMDDLANETDVSLYCRAKRHT